MRSAYVTESDFAAAIRAAPEDNAPRLAYADWLDEHAGEVECPRARCTAEFDGAQDWCPFCAGKGHVPDGRHARAEFIRVQIELAGLLAEVEKWAKTPSDQPGGSKEDGGAAGAALADAQTLQRRERELFVSRGCDWFLSPLLTAVRLPSSSSTLGHTHPYKRPPVVGVVRRGFVESVSLPLAAFLEHAAPIFAAHPVTKVALADRRCFGSVTSAGWQRESRTRQVWDVDAHPERLDYAIPDEIFELLDKPEDRNSYAKYWYPTDHPTRVAESAATDALSDALVRFGRPPACGRCGDRHDWHDALTGDGRCYDCRGVRPNLENP
jgi:uncharacterized protein (TIGR02996 family)